MKKYLFIIPLLVCCGLLACKKDFLEIVPKGNQIAITTNDYSLIMNSSSLYTVFAGGWQAPAMMGDDVAAEAAYFNAAQLRSKQAFTWADDIYQNGDAVYDMLSWTGNMYTINKVIKEVMQSAGGSEEQKRQIQAEALAYRAWLNFQFVNFFGKPYVASTAAADPAFPIIITADITTENFTRASVRDMYTAIIADFKAAIPYLPLTNAGGATRFSKSAAEGLLGKAYLFMGDNQNALINFEAAFSDNTAAKVPARLYNYNQEFSTGGKFVPVTRNGPNNSPEIVYTDLTESLLSFSFYNGVFNGNGFGTDFIVLSPQARALFQPSDLRLNFYSPTFPFGTPNPSGRLSKYNSFSGPVVKYGLQISELYLLRAECKVRLNNLSGAKADLEMLRRSRMPIADATVEAGIASSQNALLQFVFDEREREFATQGYRWFDMRRISVDPLLVKPTYTHILYKDASSSNTASYMLDPKRLTMRIPISIMIANPQFVNNP